MKTIFLFLVSCLFLSSTNVAANPHTLALEKFKQSLTGAMLNRCVGMKGEVTYHAVAVPESYGYPDHITAILASMVSPQPIMHPSFSEKAKLYILYLYNRKTDVHQLEQVSLDNHYLESDDKVEQSKTIPKLFGQQYVELFCLNFLY